MKRKKFFRSRTERDAEELVPGFAADVVGVDLLVLGLDDVILEVLRGDRGLRVDETGSRVILCIVHRVI